MSATMGMQLREAVRLHREGDFEAAAAIYRAVLAEAPDNADAHHLIGLTEAERGRTASARKHLERAVALKPAEPLFLTNLAQLHQRAGDRAAAISCLGKAHELAPEDGKTALALSRLLRADGRAQEAQEVLAAGLTAPQDDPALYLEAAVTAQALGRMRRAVGHYKQALRRGAAAGACWTGLAITLSLAGRYLSARLACARALETEPDNVVAKWIRLRLGRMMCDWSAGDAEALEDIETAIKAGQLVVQPFSLLSVAGSPALHRAAAERWTAHQAPPDPRAFTHKAPDARRPLRVGYLSSEFRAHAMGWLLAGLFQRHDRERVTPYGYAYGPDDGSETARHLRDGFDRFAELRTLGHGAAAERIRQDGIDILVDLKGHTIGSRPEILARRPAPLQVSWLGYPGTSGAPYLDYIIADREVIPPRDEGLFTEAVVRLPYSYQVTDPDRPIADRPASRAACGLPEDGFVFCCFNALHKVGPEVFARWSALLQAVEGSCLWLLEGPTEAVANLRRAAADAGLDPGRLVFAGRLPQAEHLARHRLADLFLDTLPYGAHTTASDALWAGLPLITCRGPSFPGRVAASLLRAVDLPELITECLDDYQALALRLARDPDALGRVRAELAQRRLSAPLFDCDRFARHLERAYEVMWAKRRAGDPPSGYDVQVEAE